MDAKIKALLKQVKMTRIAKDISQKEMAFALGMDAAYLSRIENGHKTPRLSTLIKLCNYLNISLYVE